MILILSWQVLDHIFYKHCHIHFRNVIPLEFYKKNSCFEGCRRQHVAAVPATCCRRLPFQRANFGNVNAALRHTTMGLQFSCLSGCVLGDRPDNSSVGCQLVVGADCRSRENTYLDSDSVLFGFQSLFTCQILAVGGRDLRLLYLITQ